MLILNVLLTRLQNSFQGDFVSFIMLDGTVINLIVGFNCFSLDT